MKKILSLALICVFTLNVYAEKKTVIRGKLLNCTSQAFRLFSSTGLFNDNVMVKPDGSFSYETTMITKPLQLTLSNQKQFNIQLFLAPGYDLIINADVKDSKAIQSTLSYQGIGGKTNTYWIENLRNFKRETDTIKWVNKDESTYLAYLKRLSTNSNALIEKIFDKTNTEDFSQHFKQVLLLDKKFDDVLSIYGSYGYVNNYSWDQVQKMYAKTGNGPLVEEFKDEKNLTSSVFQYILGTYSSYLRAYNAFPTDNMLAKQNDYSLYIGSKFYTGKVYDSFAARQIGSLLSGMFNPDDFKKFDPYIQKIGDPLIKDKVKALETSRIRTLMGLLPGAPSPLFNLADTSGKFYQLAAMKGKVVYIDLWASWCGPCKQETPYLKKIYDQYKNNDKIEIISIATFDVKNRAARYDIIKKDKMDWLQLEDSDDSFAKSYHAYTIPRFIIIDKEGKIVDSDAVRPSEPEKLMAILNREISK